MNFYNSVKDLLDKLALEVVMIEPDDLLAFGVLMNRLDELVGLAENNQKDNVVELAKSIKSIAGILVLGEAKKPDDCIKQIKDGVSLLQEIVKDESNGVSVTDKIDRYLCACGLKEGSSAPVEQNQIIEEEASQPSPSEEPKKEPPPQEKPAFQMPDFAQDKELIENFIMEALENFRDIEVSIVELEQDPTNLEIINDVFRPFHTIKGVSGFLNLTEINRLTHNVETVLDEARDQRLTIDETIIDLVLAAIDLTKSMINHLDKSIKTGVVEPVDFKIDKFITRLKTATGGHHAEESEAPKPQPKPKPQAQKPVEHEEIVDKEKDDDPAGAIPFDEDEEEEAPAPKAKPSESGRAVSKKMAQGPAFVKVDTLKLDNMIDMVGELVINQAMLVQEIGSSVATENRKLYSSLTQLTRITSEIQRISMSMRMIPIKHTFQKMIRLIRDLSKKSGKQVTLKMNGEETEIDRNMVDEIYDPLVHLVRNSVDHGLELPDERTKVNKPVKGVVSLNAYHKGGNIVIEIKDDGRGLNKEKIVKKAIEKGMVKPGEVLSDQEVYNIIFQPGFSTADQITDVSGRGVGMDVVKRVIDNMRGKLEINTEKGVGTTIWMKLPLTLAIIDGIIVRAGGRDYIMPTASIVESLRPDKEACKHVTNTGELIKIRENLHPLIRLHEIFGFKPTCYNPWEGIVMVAESDGRTKCILVDEIVGKQEVVIKNLGGLKKVKGMAGGAILADGRVGLILDVAGLFEISED